MAFSDNLILVASSEKWVQSLLDYTSNYLSNYGLLLNNNKSFTIAIRNVPHAKKSIVDRNIKFKCGDQELTALTRTSANLRDLRPKLQLTIDKLTKASVKPQQKLFALRTYRLLLGYDYNIAAY